MKRVYTSSTKSSSPASNCETTEPATRARVFVGRTVAEAGERRVDRMPAETEVALGLASDGEERTFATQPRVLAHLRLGGADDGGVVPAAQPAVGGDHDLRGAADLVPRHEHRIGAVPDRLQVAHDLGDAVGVRLRGVHARLRLDDATRGDQLHRARDLLRRLHRLDAAPQDALLPTAMPMRSSLRPDPGPRRSRWRGPSLRRCGRYVRRLHSFQRSGSMCRASGSAPIAPAASWPEARLELAHGVLERVAVRQRAGVADRRS